MEWKETVVKITTIQQLKLLYQKVIEPRNGIRSWEIVEIIEDRKQKVYVKSKSKRSPGGIKQVLTPVEKTLAHILIILFGLLQQGIVKVITFVFHIVTIVRSFFWN